MRNFKRQLLLITLLQAVLISPGRAGEPPALYQLRRDPFNTATLTPPNKAAEPGPTPEATIIPFTLRATLIGQERSLANLDGQIVAEGEELRGYRIRKIDENEVAMEKDGQPLTVFLQK